MNSINLFFINNGWALFLILIWSLFWIGCSLWFAAKRDQKWWFLVLLILNTAGVLEIIYIFFVAKKKWDDVVNLFRKSKPQQM